MAKTIRINGVSAGNIKNAVKELHLYAEWVTRKEAELVEKLASGGMTVLLTSHQLFDVQDICSRVAVVSEGRQVGGGTVAEIVANAKDKRHALEEYFEERLNIRKDAQ